MTSAAFITHAAAPRSSCSNNIPMHLHPQNHGRCCSIPPRNNNLAVTGLVTSFPSFAPARRIHHNAWTSLRMANVEEESSPNNVITDDDNTDNATTTTTITTKKDATTTLDAKAKQYNYKPPTHDESFLAHLESVKSSWTYDEEEDDTTTTNDSDKPSNNNNDWGVRCTGEPSIDPSRMVQSVVDGESNWI
eukprot:CAMPEP_0183731342 /NCGR_PEP_ID=MMETSP0737-20130205/35148_1 /TAXON_ID=385413 /ORGANISM="Thalassiosira miniscula, Strain CCMP1093" /LENGTH=190 /DNA_ID=CAMNT_0025964049 /DNA_START=1 /DNA_END=573 /DNA_ORIENTATION=-